MKELLNGMLNGMKDVLAARSGQASCEMLLLHSGITDFSILNSPEISDRTLIRVLENFCRNLNVTVGETAEAYGESWFNFYIPKITRYLGRDVRDSRSFLVKLNDIHSPAGKFGPFFHYDWKDENTLVLTCTGLEEWENLPHYFIKGMVKGVAKYYREKLEIFTGPLNSFIIIFPEKRKRLKKML